MSRNEKDTETSGKLRRFGYKSGSIAVASMSLLAANTVDSSASTVRSMKSRLISRTDTSRPPSVATAVNREAKLLQRHVRGGKKVHFAGSDDVLWASKPNGSFNEETDIPLEADVLGQKRYFRIAFVTGKRSIKRAIVLAIPNDFGSVLDSRVLIPGSVESNPAVTNAGVITMHDSEPTVYSFKYASGTVDYHVPVAVTHQLSQG